MWSTQTGERAPFWCTVIIFTCAGGHIFVLHVVVHQRTHYAQDLHYNIPRNWVVQNLSPGYMDLYCWHKFMSHFPSMCVSSPINYQVLLYDGHDSHFDYRVLNILHRHHILSLILRSGDSVHDKPNNNGQNMKINDLYGNEIMNWMRQHGTLKLTLSHMNYVLVETWESFKLSSTKITQKDFKKTRLLPLSLSGIDGNYRVITFIFKKYGNLLLCLDNYALFSLPLLFTKKIYTYTLSNITYFVEHSGNTISNYYGTFVHIFMHGYYLILKYIY